MSEATRSEAGRDHGFQIALVAVAAAIAVISVVLNLGSDRFSNNLANVLEIAAPLIAVWAAASAARHAEGRGWRVGWWMIAASCLSWAVGQTIWTWFETIRDQTDSVPLGRRLLLPVRHPLGRGRAAGHADVGRTTAATAPASCSTG